MSAGKADVRRAFEPRADQHLRTSKAWTDHKFCLRRDHDRKRIAVYVDERQRALRRQRQSSSLTPYDCGSAGSFAIPCYVVACESHYNWGAVNGSSGARGAYQMLPSTYAGVCVTCDWSKRDQHRAAAAVWARSGGGEWTCA